MLDFSSWLLFSKIIRPPSPQDFFYKRFFGVLLSKPPVTFRLCFPWPCLTSGMFHADQPIFFLILDVVYLLEILQNFWPFNGPMLCIKSAADFLSYFSVPSVTAMGFEERLGPYPGLTLPSDKQRAMILK